MAQTSIYPEQFYNILHPTQPWISVQFRNAPAAEGDISTQDIWLEIAEHPNNFFESMEISDKGGSKQISLVLYDEYFSYIENIVNYSLFVTRQDNASADNTKVVKVASANSLDTSKLNNTPPINIAVNSSDDLQAVVSNVNMVNFRVRFGYGDTNDNDQYFDKIGLDFIDRVKSSKPTIRSDWYYFMMNGVTSNFAEDGLHMTITGFSLTSTFLSNVKMVQKFAKIVDTPKNIIESFSTILSTNGLNSSITISPWKSTKAEGALSDDPLEDSKNPRIEILLGADPTVDNQNKIIYAYKPMGDIFNEIISAVPIIYLDKDGGKITPDDNGNVDSYKTIAYKYSILADRRNPGQEIIKFYYPDPDSSFKNQELIRNYTWREYGKTIIESFNISTATDFAILSQKIYTKSPNTGINLIDLRPANYSKSDNDITINPNLGVASAKNKLVNVVDFSMVSDVIEAKDTGSSDSNPGNPVLQLQNAFVKSINQQVFKGTIVLPGDPFYSFDEVMSPAEYVINVNMMRPSESGAVTKSYVSGTYTITEIKHSVNNTGFKTTLTLLRVPIVNKDNVEITDKQKMELLK